MSKTARLPGPHLLSGLRILDLGTMVAGPVACTLFADFGAEVIKVGGARPWRHRARPRAFCRRHLPVLERRGPQQEVDHAGPARARGPRAAAGPDRRGRTPWVENFRPGTLERWGLGYEVMRERNPDLVLLRISGFGQTGPYRERAGYDRIALAFGGLMGITGYADRPPVRIGTSIADYQSAILGAFALMMAIYHRDLHGGGGQEIDLAMYESIIRFTEVLVPAYDRMGTVRERCGNKHFAAAPGEHFRTSDGRYLILTISADAGFQRLCKVMGRDDWASDPRLATHEKRWAQVDELNRALAEWIACQPVDELCQQLDDAKLAYSFIYSVADIMKDPHYEARGTIATVDDPQIGPIRMAGVVPKFSATPEQKIAPAPELGQHNQDIYGGLLGLADERIAALVKAGVL